MRLVKIYNNNIVRCIKSNGEEYIVTGAGVGFNKKVGQQVEEERIDQRFHMENKKTDKINQLLERIPLEYFELSEKIIQEFHQVFHREFDASMFIPFTDHLCAAIDRAKNNIFLPNLSLMEVKTIWKQEFKFSLWVLEEIEKQVGVKVPMDEAAYFAVYFIPETKNGVPSKSMEMVQQVSDIIRIIENGYDIDIDKESIDYMRLVTHLRFFIGRVKNGEKREESMNEGIYRLLTHNNELLVECGRRIVKYIKKELDYDVTRPEIMYLLIHINQILNK